MKNPIVVAVAMLMLMAPPVGMIVYQAYQDRQEAFAMHPSKVPGKVLMYTSPG